MASCVAVISIIYYVRYQNETIPQYDPYGKLSSPRPVIITNEASVRGQYGNVEVTTSDYETEHIFNHKTKLATITEEESYTTTDLYSSEIPTEKIYSPEQHDYSTEQYETHIFNHKFHTTTEQLESDEQDDYLPSTMTPNLGTHIFNHKHHTTTEKSIDYEKIDDLRSSTPIKNDEPHATTEPFEEYNQEGFDDSDSDSESYYYDEIKM